MADTVIYQKRNDEKVKIFDSKEYAKIGGTYPDLTAGNAEQLLSDDYVADTAPYTFRTAGGNVDIGDREYDELVGGTIAWNQIIKNGNFQDGTNSWSVGSVTCTVADNIATLTAQADGDNYVQQAYSGKVGHKYLLCVDAWTDTALSVSIINIFFGGPSNYKGPALAITNQWVTFSLIVECVTTQYNLVRIRNPLASATTKFRNIHLHDLTAMFGTAIADHIYALEQATPGAGVAWFRAHFSKDYYAYDAGSLQSVQAASHDMVGFNQFDGELEFGNINAQGQNDGTSQNYVRSKNYIHVFPSTTYCMNFKAQEGYLQLYLIQYDVNKNVISRGAWRVVTNVEYEHYETQTLSANTHYIRFFMYKTPVYASLSGNEICINLSWSGYRNGEYEPYEKHSYPLDSTLTLRGIPKLDASNNLYYDGDIYASDGTVTRRCRVVDLSANAGIIGYSSRYNCWYSAAQAFQDLDVTNFGSAICPNIIFEKYQNVESTSVIAETEEAIAARQTNIAGINLTNTGGTVNLWIYNGSTTEKPTGLIYVLVKNPTTETADAFQSPQIVNDFGTEQYVDAAVAAGTRDVAIPVGHDTRYTQNLRDKLRRLPNMPDSEGLYLVRYDDRQCEFEEYVIPYSDATPQELGVATAGTSTNLSRADHVHERPAEIDINRKKLDNVLSLMNGALSVQQTDATSAYSKAIPAKAQPYASIESIGGKTMCWNQLVTNGNFSSGTTDWYSYNGATISIADGTLTVETSTSTGPYFGARTYIQHTNAHVYLYAYTAWASESVSMGVNNNAGTSWAENITTTATTYQQIKTANNTIRSLLTFSVSDTTIDFYLKNVMVFDLTLMFGSGNEPSTVAEFQQRFPTINPAYNPGSLISAGVTGVVSRGRNLVDVKTALANINDITIEEDGLVNITSTANVLNKVLWTNTAKEPGVFALQYDRKDIGPAQMRGAYIKVYYTDGTNENPGTTGRQDDWTTISVTTNTEKVVDKIAGSYNTSTNQTQWRNIQLERGSTATPYTPYRAPVTLPIPAAVQALPGYGWSAGSGAGEAYSMVDLVNKKFVCPVTEYVLKGTEPWAWQSNNDLAYLTAPGMKITDFVTQYNVYIICDNAEITPSSWVNRSTPTLAMGTIYGGAYLYLKGASITSAADAIAYFTAHPTTVRYVLDTPNVTDISQYLTGDNLIEVEPGGTISFPSQLGDDYRIPVPSTEEYTIDMAPDTPSTDGTYTLQCTVTDGVPTYSWVSA